MIYGALQGGLGNQMFQYAFCRMLQLRTGQKARLDISGLSHGPFALRHFRIETQTVEYAQKIHLMPSEKHLRTVSKWICRFYHVGPKAEHRAEQIIQQWLNPKGLFFAENGYCKMKVPADLSDYCFYGYFLSPRYFEDIQEQIRREFSFREAPTGDNATLMKQILHSEAACIHIRRGDYVQNPQTARLHHVCDIAYYERAIEVLLKAHPDAKLFVFSDDAEWVKNNLQFPAETVYATPGNEAWQDLQLMAACRHYVLSNSTFSWWAQYLGKTPYSMVLAPSRWFNDNRPADYYEPGWTLIKV
jgi:hypothetical protein